MAENFEKMRTARETLAGIFHAGVDAVRGKSLLTSRSRYADGMWTYEHEGQRIGWRLPGSGRVIVIGAGKAAASLAAGLEEVLGPRIDDGCVIVKYDHREPLDHIRLMEAGHPVPDSAGLAATGELLRTIEGLTADDRVFVLLTGGASSLLVCPAPGVSLEEKAAVTEIMLRSGAAIDEMNEVRKAISRVKGGRLLDRIGPAQTVTLVISDVPGGRAGSIGSGPTVRDRQSAKQVRAILDRYGIFDCMPDSVKQALSNDEEGVFESPPADGAKHRFVMLADSRTALDAARMRAETWGYAVQIVDADMKSNTHAAAQAFAGALRQARAQRLGGGPPTVLLAAGETTLKVEGNGRGGRNQEFALVAARHLSGISGVALLSGGTDGTDGPTDAAGAFADGGSCDRAAAAGQNVADALDRNDSYTVFAAMDDLFFTGATGTNVMDLVIGLVE